MKVFSHSAPLCMLAGMLVASPALGVQLVSNGPFITNPGAHASGEDVSLAQDVTYSGYTALGFNAGPDYRLADDFSVPPGHYWTIDSARLFAYQTGAGDAPFTDARVIIWQGQPDGFGSIKLFDGIEPAPRLVSGVKPLEAPLFEPRDVLFSGVAPGRSP